MKKAGVSLVILSAIFLMNGCDDKVRPGEKEAERPLVDGVVTWEVTRRDVGEYYETAGVVKAVNTSLVSSRIMGEVKDIAVKVSDRVKIGDVLLVIDSPDIEARVEAARAGLEEAREEVRIAGLQKRLMERTFERFSNLFKEDAVTKQEFDEIKAKKEVRVFQFEKAQKSLRKVEAMADEAEALEGYRTIRSPVTGIVAERKIDKGTMTAPGMPLFVIEEPVYRIEVAVDEKLLESVRIGEPVDIQVEAARVRTTGRVGEIVHRVDPDTRTFTVKIDLAETPSSLRGGLSAKASFLVGTASGIFISDRALVHRGKLEGAYVVSDDGIVSLRLLRTGKKTDGMVEVLSGLSEGELVIVDGVERAVDGGRLARRG